MEHSIVMRERKTPVLRRGTFGCLLGIDSVNVTIGCLVGCVYCYARGYPGAPGRGKVILFSNLTGRLSRELKRKRRRVGLVLFNTASDSFQPHPDIITTSVDLMETVLDRGVAVSFLTKGVVPRRFLGAVRDHPGLVFARIGIVCLDSEYQRKFEPFAATPAERLSNIEGLIEADAAVEVRIDPVIPFVTDGRAQFDTLFREVAARGIRRATISWLSLRPAVEDQVKGELDPLTMKLIDGLYRTASWRTVGLSTMTKLVPYEIRRRGYERACEAADRYGVTLSICSCKNPDLPGGLCSKGLGIGSKGADGAPQQLTLRIPGE